MDCPENSNPCPRLETAGLFFPFSNYLSFPEILATLSPKYTTKPSKKAVDNRLSLDASPLSTSTSRWSTQEVRGWDAMLSLGHAFVKMQEVTQQKEQSLMCTVDFSPWRSVDLG